MLAERHRILLGQEATENQLRLYRDFPNFRGFSNVMTDRELFDATLVAALLYGELTERVAILVPLSMENWALEQISKVCDEVFKGCKKTSDPVRAARAYGKMFQKLGLTSRVLRLVEPPRWVAFGFKKEDTLPEWLPDRLISL